jgi:mono/diheme cytochrome c family protein
MRVRTALAVLALLFPPPAPAQERAAANEIGGNLYLDYCAVCHGEDATAGAPGDIRGLSRSTFNRALRGIEQMPAFNYFTDDEVEALAAWLRIPQAE